MPYGDSTRHSGTQGCTLPASTERAPPGVAGYSPGVSGQTGALPWQQGQRSRVSQLWGASFTSTCSLAGTSWASMGPKTCPTPLTYTPSLTPRPGPLLSCHSGQAPRSAAPSATDRWLSGHIPLATSHRPRHCPQMVGAASCRARLAAASDVSRGGGEKARAQSCPGCGPRCLGAPWGPRAWGWEAGQGLNMLPCKKAAH